MKEPEPLRQIHKIQEKIYRKTKDMTSDEFIEYLNENTKNVLDYITKSKINKNSASRKRKAS